MKSLRNILLILLVPLVISGCATTKGKTVGCAVIGGIAGGTAGGFIAEKAVAGIIPGGIAGALVGYMLCQDGDADKDGVSDSKDLCKKTPKGAKVNKDGCSDLDNDGVPKNKDQCPNTPPGAKVDAKGCKTIVCGEIIANLKGDVYFDTAKYDISGGAASSLDQVVNKLREIDTNLHIVGHTDSIGPEKANDLLSIRRAGSVKGYLASHGVDSSITTEGKGEKFPIASNDTKEGRAINRRVEIIATCK